MEIRRLSGEASRGGGYIPFQI